MTTALEPLLTPELFRSLFQARLPYVHNEPLDFDKIGADFSMSFPSAVKPKMWSALVALSKYSLDKMPDLTQFLPAVQDPSYPEQCFGLTILLDQGPRMLCEGIDGRWTDTFFGVLVQRVTHSWLTLPSDQQPNSWARWQKLGASFDFWTQVHFWFTTPMTHSEAKHDQETFLAMTEDRRRAVETHTGSLDPYREKRAEILTDIYAFPSIATKGPPRGDDVTLLTWASWSGMLLDTHWPIVHHFGRYPYRNAVQGRKSTPEEVDWVHKTHHVGEVDEETARRVGEDVAAGRWTPLDENKEFV